MISDVEDVGSGMLDYEALAKMMTHKILNSRSETSYFGVPRSPLVRYSRVMFY